MLTAATTPVPELWTPEWWAVFLTSPGFAGLAATLAALTTVATVMFRGRIDRRLAADARLATEDADRHTRQRELADREAEHWWEMYSWAIKNMPALRAEPVSSLALFHALADQAPTDTETALLLVAIEMLDSGSTP
ncbi:hypothetical protein [Cellulomonas sp. Leaf334]|uniref:hypothetical protein n=1 Tax=Cellulomonas sp. Leaf334 TaxID=1736339 RepID=UPI0006F7DA61|nr:hypothetical protein [Cellulomonas sp. Leaf334]KQR17263.1 hypothetical protein ASF78_08185 [Cellulomonas sp. Leaf334]